MQRFLGILLLVASLAAFAWASGVDQPLRQAVHDFVARGTEERAAGILIAAAGAGLIGLLLALSPVRRRQVHQHEVVRTTR